MDPAAGMVLVACLMLLVGTGCSGQRGDFIGLKGVYNYSPSVILSGQVTKYWWCGQADNPAKPSQLTDTIQYESIDAATGETKGPLTVLAETPGSWDSVYTCNPSVIEGSFNNPLGDGQTYQYAMYYVAADSIDGETNNIGVAFSKDGMHWNKYPQPVIRTDSPTGYGVGQPALYNVDQKAGIRMFYEDYNPTVRHVAAISTDGVHFTVQGTLTTLGLDPNIPNWGNMAFDPTTSYWYAAFNLPLRDPSTTGGITERGQLGAALYKIPDAALLTGSAPWQELYTVDTNRTGFESNFIAAILHDAYGNVNVGKYPAIQMFVSISRPQPAWDASPTLAAKSAEPPNWVITSETWTPNNPLLPLYRFNKDVHEVTTGWIDPGHGFLQESVLGHLYESPQQGASVAFYGCKNGNTDYFVSLDSACEGQRILGKDGYGYAQPVAGLNLVALYRCSTGHDHFVSQDPKCEGETTDERLGYVVP